MNSSNLSAHSLVVDRGWWQADLGGVLVTYMDQRMADDAYGRYRKVERLYDRADPSAGFVTKLVPAAN